MHPAEMAITSADEKFLQKVMSILKEHYMEAIFNIDFFEKELGLSRTQFYHKMKALTNERPPANSFVTSDLKKQQCF